MNRAAHTSGFTLVEALIALAILGLSLAVLFKIISDNLDRTHRAQDEATAASLVQSLLAQSEAITPPTGVSNGRYDGGYSWRLQVSPYAGAQARADWPVDAVTISATVSWRDGGAAHSRTLTTLRVIPKARPK